MEYKAETIYEQDDFIGFMKAYVQKTDNLRIMAKVSKNCARAAGALVLLAGVINIGKAVWDYWHGVDLLTMRQAAFQLTMIVGGAMLLALHVDDILGKIAWRRYEGQGMRLSYCFFDGYFTRTMQGHQHKFSYSIIKSIYRDTGRYYLFINEASAHIIPFDSFAGGEAETFGEFLREKTGLEEVHL